MRSVVTTGLASAAFAIATWVIAWWAVVIVALILGASLHDDRRATSRVALAAGIAWGALVAFDAIRGSFSILGETLAGVIHLPVVLLVVVTVLFPTALAWSASTIGAAAARVVASESRSPMAPVE